VKRIAETGCELHTGAPVAAVFSNSMIVWRSLPETEYPYTSLRTGRVPTL